MPTANAIHRLLAYVWEFRRADHYKRFYEDAIGLSIACLLAALQDLGDENEEDWIVVKLVQPSHVSSAVFFEEEVTKYSESATSRYKQIVHILLHLQEADDLSRVKKRLNDKEYEFLGVFPSIFLQGPGGVTLEITTSDLNRDILSQSPQKARDKLTAWQSQKKLWRNALTILNRP